MGHHEVVRAVSQSLVKERFSWLFEAGGVKQRELWDQPLASTKSFVAVPSLGSLVPGWLLVVPKRRLLNMSFLDTSEQEELQQLTFNLQQRLRVFDGTVYAFEHGSGHIGSQMGCGVDQAHLHLVPLDFDLLNIATNVGTGISWKHVPDAPLTNLPAMGEYIAVWRLNDLVGAVGKVRVPVSQWMRRIIARELGVESEWNYRTTPQTEIIRQTVERLRARATPAMK